MNELMHQNEEAFPPQKIPGDANEDDGAVLRAVRAFLMDDDVICALDSDEEKSRLVPFSGNSSSANDSRGSATVELHVLPRKVPAAMKDSSARPRTVNRSRVRQQNEIFSLRQQSIALERRLAQIQHGGTASDTTDSIATPSTSLQTAALKQRELLEAAERERAKLRKKVNECKQAIARVRHFLRRQIQKQSTAAKLIQPDTLHVSALDLDTSVGYEDLSKYLERMYAQLGSVFEGVDLDRVTRVTDELHKMRIQNEDTLSMLLELVESRVLPFDVATTAKAVWDYQTVKARDARVAVVEDSENSDENVLRRTYVSSRPCPHFKGHVLCRWEARRIVDRDRVIIMQCSTSHRIERTSGVDAVDGFGTRILAWNVISPPRDEHLRTASGRSVSHVDSLEIVMPFIAEGNSGRYDTPEGREEVKTFCLASIELVHKFERQAVENILLSGTM